MQGATGLIIFLIEYNYRHLKYQHGFLVVRKISVRLNQEDLGQATDFHSLHLLPFINNLFSFVCCEVSLHHTGGRLKSSCGIILFISETRKSCSMINCDLPIYNFINLLYFIPFYWNSLEHRSRFFFPLVRRCP